MKKITDSLHFCVYCGATAKTLTKEQIKIFGAQECCEHAMLEIDMSKVLIVVKALDKLKSNLEKEILEGMQ